MMVTLNAGGSGETPQPAANRSMVAKGHPLHHRRRRPGPRGTLAGFGYKASSSSSNTPELSSGSPSPDTFHGEGPSSDMNPSAGAGSSSSAHPGGKQQPQHNASSSSEAPQPPAKPCHSARMAALCCQNALRLGARAQLGLCPPGRSRRSLQAALRQRTRTSTSVMQSSGNNSNRRLSAGNNNDTIGYYALEKMVGAQSLEDYEDQEEDYLLSTNTYDIDSDEEASSGDEDEIINIASLLAPDKPMPNDESKYGNLREPLFTPIGAEGSLSNPNGAPSMAAMGTGASGKLPFNRRKIRFFDGIGAVERQTARDYLQREATKSRQRNALLLSRHLRRMQLEEKRKARIEKGENPDNDNLSDIENEDAKEQALLTGGVSQFDRPMTAAMSAALILESLSLNPLESVEGMSKCYDGIVAAGVALLDSQMPDPTSPNDDDKERPTRADILAALAPLLITSLDQPSGEVILHLAKLRRMCGTARYQRRFVQRVAPCLVRPRGAAMWCLRHQRDMEPILAAAELIFDSAHEVFCKGWYEKGQLYLADSKRAETLNSAAMQLRNLSAEPAEGLLLGFATHHGMRRTLYHGASAQKDTKNSSDHLAEWEVMAVDQEIRISISKIMSSDWNKVALTARDSDSVSRSLRRAPAVTKRPSVLPQPTSGEASPRAMMSSPRSPSRLIVNKTPLSPPNTTSASTSETLERAFESGSVSTQSAERPMSPLSPPPHPVRTSQDESDLKLSNVSASTPPRSPKSPHTTRSDPMEHAPTLSTVASAAIPFAPTSPARSKSPLPSRLAGRDNVDLNQVSNVPFTPSLSSAAAPLSPNSVGTSTSANDMHFRPSSGSSVISSGSGASQTAHYRTLTSTAAERKRTVAACRALRAQITRFEDAFFQLHGRPPKGAAERAPLATTYSQYREWKRAIRADAACRIQALFRGARTRWYLMRSSDPRIRRIVLSRAGRVQFPSRNAAYDPPGVQGMSQDLIKQIGIPVEIGASDSPSGMKPATSPGSPIRGDIFASQVANASLAPQWGNHVVRQRPGSDGFPTATAPKPHTPPHGPDNRQSDGPTVSLADLQTRKRELKQQLKQYDMSFARRHGRMPVKAEKEPIRHLYESYNQLKSQITLMEQEAAARQHHHSPGPGPGFQQLNMRRGMAPSAASAPSSESDDSSRGEPGFIPRVSKKKQIKAPPAMTALPAPVAVANPQQDLASLKAEKGQLHLMLRSYEKDFFKQHKRQVSSFADIKPVASQYRRYKEIKKAISQLQSGGER